MRGCPILSLDRDRGDRDCPDREASESLAPHLQIGEGFVKPGSVEGARFLEQQGI